MIHAGRYFWSVAAGGELDEGCEVLTLEVLSPRRRCSVTYRKDGGENERER